MDSVAHCPVTGYVAWIRRVTTRTVDNPNAVEPKKITIPDSTVAGLSRPNVKGDPTFDIRLYGIVDVCGLAITIVKDPLMRMFVLSDHGRMLHMVTLDVTTGAIARVWSHRIIRKQVLLNVCALTADTVAVVGDDGCTIYIFEPSMITSVDYRTPCISGQCNGPYFVLCMPAEARVYDRKSRATLEIVKSDLISQTFVHGAYAILVDKKNTAWCFLTNGKTATVKCRLHIDGNIVGAAVRFDNNVLLVATSTHVHVCEMSDAITTEIDNNYSGLCSFIQAYSHTHQWVSTVVATTESTIKAVPARDTGLVCLSRHTELATDIVAITYT